MNVLKQAVVVSILCSFFQQIRCLDNGLAITPPMGWMSWERFRCVIDCEKDSRNCISERLYMEMADVMYFGGYRDAGYQYVCIDDCWAAMNRTKDGSLQADPKRFPSGIKKLADYIHARGLKLGIYADYGAKTCEGYPGSINYVNKDAQRDVGYQFPTPRRNVDLLYSWPLVKTFADWGVDYLKLDGCNANSRMMDEGYPKFSIALNKTGRPIVFSCSWPAYLVYMEIKPDYRKIGKYCNLWRNYYDIQDSFFSVYNIYEWYAAHQDDLIPVAGQGHWNDPDMLIIGNFGLSYEQSKLQFALWAIMASPLLMSNDLRDIDSRSREILLNTEVIAVNQDRLGKQGKRVVQNLLSFTEVWARPLSECGSVAVVLLSIRSDLPVDVEASFCDVGITTERAYARDLFAHKELGVYKKSFTARVNPSGVVMVKLIPICDEGNTDKKTNKKEKKIADSKTDEKEIEKTDKNKALKTDETEDRKRCQCVKLN